MKAQQIIDLVCIHYGISEARLNLKNRDRAIVKPRQMAHTLLKENTKLSLADIGALVGSKDHATVLYSIKSIHNLADAYMKNRIEYEQLTIKVNKIKDPDILTPEILLSKGFELWITDYYQMKFNHITIRLFHFENEFIPFITQNYQCQVVMLAKITTLEELKWLVKLCGEQLKQI